MWMIIAIVTLLGVPAGFASNDRFPTEEACKMVLPDRIQELADHVMAEVPRGSEFTIQALCHEDVPGQDL